MNNVLVASRRGACASSCKISDLPLHVRARIMEHLVKSNSSSDEHCNHPSLVSDYIVRVAGVSGNLLPEILLAPALASQVFSAAVAELLGSHARNLTRQTTKRQLSLWLRALRPYVTAVGFHDTHLIDVISDLYLYNARFKHRNRRAARLVLCDVKDVLLTLSQAHFGISKLDLSQVPWQYATIVNSRKLRNALAACLRQNASALQELTLGDCAICLNSLDSLCLPKLKRLEFQRTRMRFITEEQPYDERKSNPNVLNALGQLKLYTDDLELVLNEVPLSLGASINIARYPSCTFLRVTSLVIQNPFGLPHSADDKVAAFISCFANIQRLQWNGIFNAANVNLILRKCRRLKAVRWRQRMGLERNFEWHDPGDFEWYEPGEIEWLDAGLLEASVLPQAFALLKEKLRALAVWATMTKQHFNALSANCLSLECIRLRIGSKNACYLKSVLRNCRGISSVTLFSRSEGINIDDEDENTLVAWPSESGQLMLLAKVWEELAEAVALASPRLRKFEVLLENEVPYEVDFMGAAKSMLSIMKSLGENAQVVRFQLPYCRGEFGANVDAACDLLNAAIDGCQNLDVFEIDSYGMSKSGFARRTEESRKEKIAAFFQAFDRLKKNAPRLHKYSFKNILDGNPIIRCGRPTPLFCPGDRL